jgi:hypothetical protein
MADQVVDIGTQLMTVGAGLAGGALGYFLGGRSFVGTAIGALVGAVAVPPLVGFAANAIAAPSTPPRAIAMQPGATLIERVKVGDTLVLEAPSGWGVPSAGANIPGFLEVVSTDTNAESTTVKVVAGGQGQITMKSGSETAVVSVEA